MSILTLLPGLAPTTRSFKMDDWPQSITKSRNGRVVRRVQVSVPSGASLDLTWENITYAQAGLLIEAWDASYGIYGTLQLDAATLAGLSGSVGSNISGLVAQPFPGAVWRASGPPTVEAASSKGRCTVVLALKTRNDISSLMAAL